MNPIILTEAITRQTGFSKPVLEEENFVIKPL